jgi:O-antigen/teichoic acid export membrane protein
LEHGSVSEAALSGGRYFDRGKMRSLDTILAWVLIVLGVMQWVATPVLFETAEEPAFWFFGGGITLVIVGILNVLRIRYGSLAPGVKVASVGSNLALAGFWVAMACTLTYKFNRFKAPYIALLSIILAAVVSVWSSRMPVERDGQG